MSALFTEGQARLAPVCRAVVALHEGSAVDVEALLWAWRRLAPRCHPGAAADDLDTAAIVDVLCRRPSALVEPLRPVEEDPRGSPLRLRIARALADACTLALEQRKLQHGMTASSSSLQAAFASPDDARATLRALADAPPISIATEPHDDEALSLPSANGPGKELHVVAGDGARRLFDLLSPAVRRLRVDLALLGRVGAVVDDDDVYRGLLRLNAREPGCVPERRAHPTEPFDDGRVFVIDPQRLSDELVDRRARALLAPLKKANVVVAGVVDVGLLPALLSLRPASVQLLSASTTSRPRALLDGAHGAVMPLDGDGPCSLSVPWLGLLPVGVDGDEDAFFGGTLVWRARVDDDTVPVPVVRLVTEGDRSGGALLALAAMVPARR